MLRLNFFYFAKKTVKNRKNFERFGTILNDPERWKLGTFIIAGKSWTTNVVRLNELDKKYNLRKLKLFEAPHINKKILIPYSNSYKN